MTKATSGGDHEVPASPEHDADEYVGYGRPPSKSRFQKGHPYYPPKAGAGRRRYLARAIERLLEEPVRVEIDGEIAYRPLAEVLVNRLVERALQDDKSTKPLELLLSLIEKHEADQEGGEKPVMTSEQARRIVADFEARARKGSIAEQEQRDE